MPVGLALLLALALAGSAGASSAEEPDGLVIHAGSVASRQVVALGRDLSVEGEAAADVAAINGSVRITGVVRGDVIVLGGGAHLGRAASVGGDVFVLGGALEASTLR